MGKLNKTISGMVVAIAADYPRMKKMLEGGNVTRDQAVLFTRYVSAVDNALIAVCRGEPAEARELLRKDIAEKNGFETSESKVYYGTFYMFNKRKYDAIKMIAEMNNLI